MYLSLLCLYFSLSFLPRGLCGWRYPKQRPHCSVELKRRVAERGRRSRGGHLCFVWYYYYYCRCCLLAFTFPFFCRHFTAAKKTFRNRLDRSAADKAVGGNGKSRLIIRSLLATLCILCRRRLIELYDFSSVGPIQLPDAVLFHSHTI